MGRVPFIGVLANIRGYGRFSSPLRDSKNLTLYRCSGAAVDVFVVPVGVEEAVA